MKPEINLLGLPTIPGTNQRRTNGIKQVFLFRILFCTNII